jgi:hypothetical protein
MDASYFFYPIACEEGELRLVGGRSETNGRVEICVRERWGTVCGDSWDDMEVEVICRQLGYLESGGGYITRSEFHFIHSYTIFFTPLLISVSLANFHQLFIYVYDLRTRVQKTKINTQAYFVLVFQCWQPL